ncbi:alpha-amylase family glycosyl hydrolase [Fibrivirga algicola]|uniref:Alpha-amylase n=1 Tax=Fibrivirga algicola TaxID=2950420 RepID=A0ABX0QN66_9BACT|nr:alpha-amylase family glycosyl hydrolase [Fibrivirga algicola]NID12726.1 alpha-amylase [Fibrivirga algicola]
MMTASRLIIACLLLLGTVTGCGKAEKKTDQTTGSADTLAYKPDSYVELKHPDWSKNATIYEVNLRQYTPEGTFNAFATHLPRLKAMGVDIIWLMPIHPIGLKNRKGTLGNPYAVKDYYGINPELGTIADFKALVATIHRMGMHVILDWVTNQSARDNSLVNDHPDWYTQTPAGTLQPTPGYDRTDIAYFDYSKPGIREYMAKALTHWVRETDIDGYRCEVPESIPVDFWENTRKELDMIKPVFMLAERESRNLHKRAFDMTYSSSLYDQMHKAATETKGVDGLVTYMANEASTFPRNGYRMLFTDNQDKNTWIGAPYSQFGKALDACVVLTATANGMPLVYSGQEAGNPKQLEVFEKDVIDWKKHPNADLFKKLFALKHANHALWNGAEGGELVPIVNDKPDQIIAFSREKAGDRVVVIVNMSDKKTIVALQTQKQAGTYQNVFKPTKNVLTGKDRFAMAPWGYTVMAATGL